MSDYKDPRHVQPIWVLPYGTPYICAPNGGPALASISGDQIAFTTPLPSIYPHAWVSTPGAWSYVKMSDKSLGQIIAEVFARQWENVDTTTGPAYGFL